MALTIISSSSNAATITISKKQHLTPLLQSQTPSDYKKNTNSPSDSFESTTIASPSTLQKSFTRYRDDFYSRTRNKERNNENLTLYFSNDYELLLKSLIGYDKIRKFVNDSESMVIKLTEELISSLKLEYKQHMQSDLITSIDLNMSSLIPEKFQGNQSIPSYMTPPQPDDALLDIEESNQLESNFISKLLQIDTLIYLISLIIILSVLKAAIKFILFRLPS